MRAQRLLSRAAQCKGRYNRYFNNVHMSSIDSMRHLAAMFGPSVQQLPPSLRVELLNPSLQQFPQRSNLFENLGHQGYLLLTVLMNRYLGTRNVVLPHMVVSRMCEAREILTETASLEDAVSLCYNFVGAVNVFVGPELCESMVDEYLLKGPLGLPAIYLDALSNNEL